MYYIANQNGEIIAADLAFMDSIDANNIGDLYRRIALGELDFQLPSETKLQISQGQQTNEYTIKQSRLSSILGEITIVEILPDVNDDDVLQDTKSLSVESEADHVESLVTPEHNEAPASEIKEEIKFDLENLLKEAEGETFPKEETDESIQALDPLHIQEEKEELHLSDTDEELFDLLLTEEASESSEEILEVPEAPEIQKVSDTEQPTHKQLSENAPILIDIQMISQKIGIDPDDYITFLDEYIDTAIQLENDLLSPDTHIRNTAIKTLSHLGKVLHLPEVNDIIESISNTPDAQNRHSRIEEFYSILSRLTTHQEHSHFLSTPELNTEASDEIPVNTKDNVFSTAAAEITTEGFGHIDLSGVTPIHFDFRIEEAADDLSLPPELIEEFVQDFIVQASEETPKMLEAYQKGDMETIQKIGHLLKGAASNLRIVPLAETLYEIQMCNDSSQLEKLIKNYWAHFLSFENKMNISSK